MKPTVEMIFWIACLLYIATQTVETARILAIIPIPSYSHQIPFRPIWTTLSQRGHKVVVITTDPINDPSLTNLTEINLKFNYEIIKKIDFTKVDDLWINVERNQIWPLSLEIVENVYKHPEVRKMYVADSNQKFDVVIVETVKAPSFYALAHRFNAPLIGKNNVYEIIIQIFHLRLILF